jgi:hypothetical protein
MLSFLNDKQSQPIRAVCISIDTFVFFGFCVYLHTDMKFGEFHVNCTLNACCWAARSLRVALVSLVYCFIYILILNDDVTILVRAHVIILYHMTLRRQ